MKIIIIVLFLSVILLNICVAGNYVAGKYSDLIAESIQPKQEKPTLKNNIIFFTAKWCVPCQQLKSTVLNTKECKDVLDKYKITLSITDIDDPKKQQYIKLWKISSVPTLKLIQSKPHNQKSVTLYTQTGYVNLKDFITIVENTYGQK